MSSHYKYYIKDVPDFPKKGIIFRDITPLLIDFEHFDYAMNNMSHAIGSWNIDAIAAIESRGFIIGTALAKRFQVPMILVRKKGKLPRPTVYTKYELEYSDDEIHVHREDIEPYNRILIVDDVLATGGTAHAAQIILGNKALGAAFLIELEGLEGRKKLTFPKERVFSLLQYL